MKQNGQDESVGDRLRRLRLSQGLSQRDLSEPGVSYAYISRIEAGARSPSVKALRKLSAKLDVTVEYLETGKDETLVDALVSELHGRTRSAVRVAVIPGLAHVRWKVDGTDLHERAPNLTEALLGAVARMRERDEIWEEQQRLAERLTGLHR